MLSGILPRRPATVAVSAALAVGLLFGLLWYGGGVTTETIPGLPEPGWTRWLLPAAELAGELAAIATVGLLLAAVVLSPRHGRQLSAESYRRLRAARWTALLWAAATGAQICLTVSDLMGLPVAEIVTPTTVGHFVTSLTLGQALLVTAGLAVATAAVCLRTLTYAGSVFALVTAVLGVVPPVFTGHAAAGGNHQVAVSGLLIHVVAVVVWAGGLGALLLSGRAPAAAVRRFSPLATWCAVAVIGSGLVSAWIRLPGIAAVVTSRYGQLMLLKAVVLAGILVLGVLQRRTAMPALDRGDRRGFILVATGEILLFAAAMGAAVALSRTPPAVVEGEESAAQALLGFPMPGPVSPAALFTAWLPEPLYLSVAVVAAGLYLAGVHRLRRRGDGWPAHRTLLFLAGCGLLAVATSSGLARYAPVLFSVHMGQHLLLNMVVPILLVLAAPATLALRALRPATDPAWPGPREWLLAVLRSRPARVIAHPLVAFVLYVGSLYAMYFTGLYELALRSHAAHLAMVGHFLGTGYLFFSCVIGVDPGPRRPIHPLRVVMVFAAMAMHAFLGIALMASTRVLASAWYESLARPWGVSPLADQHTGGGLAWSFGELPMAVVLGALLVQWMRADDREARRRDRAADRAEAAGGTDPELAAYNAMLAALAARDGRSS
ncbi:cytochrome c oxidase assembly protein [Actinoplanes subglobosus]|uniref:Cytochrome c oxidase assembly protein n=1 Tax=Actinoplanes subglobosus TaxID=1547892 RepID=A0ABV8IS47_9ACTN